MNVIRECDAPGGASLVEQARAVMQARVNEFQGQARRVQREEGQTFDIYGAVRAIGQGSALERMQAVVALQEFMHAPGRASKRLRGRLYEMISAGDMTTVNNSARDYIDKFLITPLESDDGWMQIFSTFGPEVAMAQSNKSGFRVLTIDSGITFKKRKRGEAIEFRTIKGADAFVEYDSYGGGAAIERVWWDDQDYISIGDVLTMFRAAAYGQQSSDMYGLLTALPSGNNFSTGADLIEKLNGAVSDIIRKLEGKGVPVTANSTFLIVCSVENRAKVQAALATQSDVAMQTAASKTKVVYNFKVVPTVRVPASGTGSGIYVGLPGGRSKAGIRQDLTLYGQFNPSRYADDLAGHLRYVGSLETAQWRRIP